MAALRVQFTRRADGTTILRCARSDGTVTWQRQTGSQAGFFPLHDLTHYAVETVLEIAEGFFGLVASGWDIDDTTGKGRRGPLPAEAVMVEHLVGLLDVERASGAEWTAEELVEQLRMAGVTISPVAQRNLAAGGLQQIRILQRDLFARWAATGVGEDLALSFGASRGSSRSGAV